MKLSSIATVVLISSFITGAPVRADFTYTETTQITGGSVLSMMKMAGTFSRQARQAGGPVTSTVIVKGNRLTEISPDHIEIIDLDKGTVTQIDTVKHEYTVITFDEMRRQMEAAMKKAEASPGQQKAQAATASSQPATTNVTFQVHVRNTGASKDIAGLTAQESIMTLSMDAKDQKSDSSGSLAITNDMWLAPEIPGYSEVRDFYSRYALRMGTVFSGATAGLGSLMSQPGAAEGMKNLAKEVAKMKGIPVLQIMRMGVTADGSALPAASEAPLPATQGSAMPTAGEVAQQTATSAIANTLGIGGFGFGRKKKQDQAAPQSAPATDSASSATASPAAPAVLIESNTQLSSFSQAPVDPAKFEVPAGYRQVSVKAAD